MNHLHHDGVTTTGFVQTEAGQWLGVRVYRGIVNMARRTSPSKVKCSECDWSLS